MYFLVYPIDLFVYTYFSLFKIFLNILDCLHHNIHLELLVGLHKEFHRVLIEIILEL